MTRRARKFLIVVGARPNLVKAAPLLNVFATRRAAGASLETLFVHTGQHYDEGMSGAFFRDLELPEPDRHLEVGSGTHAEQTAKVMLRFEPVCVQERPDLVIVLGDVNSTLACALVAAKLNIPVAHVEAGLRSDDRTMPEEINRVLTDHLSQFLFTPSADAQANLLKEGIAASQISFVGNIMVDTLLAQRARAAEASVRAALGVADTRYAVATLHRPSNVDDEHTLRLLMDTLSALPLPVVFPVHPRTASRLNAWGLVDRGGARTNLRIVEPLGYLSFLDLLAHATFVLTDSGGIQEETTALDVPCLTMREKTERPITVSLGTSTLVGAHSARIIEESRVILQTGGKRGTVPPLWDGHTAERIADILLAERA